MNKLGIYMFSDKSMSVLFVATINKAQFIQMVYTALDQFQIYLYTCIYKTPLLQSIRLRVKELLNIEDGTNNEKQWEVKEVACTKSVSQFGFFLFGTGKTEFKKNKEDKIQHTIHTIYNTHNTHLLYKY